MLQVDDGRFLEIEGPRLLGRRQQRRTNREDECADSDVRSVRLLDRRSLGEGG